MNSKRPTAMLLLLISLFLVHLPNSIYALPSPPITALYVFGDSTVDPGNNNYILTLFKSNHPPYGNSFPSRLPTGRFTDGKLSTDFVSSSLGLKPTIPAYLNHSVKPVDLLTGVSFASAGTGLDDRTALLSFTLTMDRQVSYFQEAIRKMRSVVGVRETNRVISNALFVVSVGTNDMIFNAYDRLFGSSVNISNYQDFILRKIDAFIWRLQRLGARRIVVAGLPPIGCLPVQVTITSPLFGIFSPSRNCMESQNDDSRQYNEKLQRLTSRLSRRIRGSKVLYQDIYSPLDDMIKSPEKYGFEETLRGCCGLGLVETGPLCGPLSLTCPDTSKYLFFDSIHPSQKAYSIIANSTLQNLIPLL